MNLIPPAIGIIAIFVQLLVQDAQADVGVRASSPLEIELLTIADYAAFNKFYKLTPATLSHLKRVEMAKQNLTTWYTTMIHSTNLVYKGLEDHNIFISIKLVDFRIMTTEVDSPWTETTKFQVDSTYYVDSDDVHPLFKATSLEYQKTVPHDHAMLFTGYELRHGPHGSNYAGNAYIAAECKSRSQSIVEDSEDAYTAHTLAHELGHSLGCEHDGDGNSCPVGAGYLMEAHYIKHNTKKWLFSSCSINYIRQFINTLNSKGDNCLARVDDHHSVSALGVATQKWVGEVYTPDQLCVVYYGKGSYFCRHEYEGNFTEVCTKFWCYDATRDGCYYNEAGNGISCGSGSWCVQDICKKDQRASSHSDSHCLAGDQEGIVENHQTCAQIVKSTPYKCLQNRFKYKCCDSCKQANAQSVSVDTQCQNKFGSGSSFCRGAHTYRDNGFSKLCENLLCTNVTAKNWCNGMDAYEKTSCGDRKWCINGQCVHDANAPQSNDACPMGDIQNDRSVTHYHLTCAELAVQKPRACYSSHTAGACCETCDRIKQPVKGCEYGDHHSGCTKSHCGSYNQDRLNTCCHTCRGTSIVG